MRDDDEIMRDNNEDIDTGIKKYTSCDAKMFWNFYNGWFDARD